MYVAGGACEGPRVAATRSIDRPSYFPGDTLTVTIAATGVTASTRISDTFPDGFTLANANGGAVEGSTISFDIDADGEVSYQLDAADDPGDCSPRTFDGESLVTGGCAERIGGVESAQNATAAMIVERQVDPESHAPGDLITVTLTVSNIVSATAIVESFDVAFTVDDEAGGTTGEGSLSFDVVVDGEIVYVLQASGNGEDCLPAGTVDGVFTPTGGCETPVGGSNTLRCDPGAFACEPDDDSIEAEYIVGFQFGTATNSFTLCESPSGEEYILVEQTSPGAIAYDELVGYGFEAYAPDTGARGGYDVFGPFDDSPNNRNVFVDGCPEEVYDTFIGFKNFLQPCNEGVVGSPDESCEEGGLDPAGGIFRVDLDDEGCYRFVAVIGDAANPHAHRVLVEDGGEGGPTEIGPNFVTLVNNFDQNQQDFGQTAGNCLGCGVFARVGFDDNLPPSGDGVAPDPQFVNMDENGLPAGACPSSPVLEVEEGYIRLHLLQGNANVGPGSKSGGTTVDPNGGDIVLLEIWRLDDCPGEKMPPEPQFRRGDVDANGRLELTDSVFVLNFLFLGGPASPCTEASDVDDNGRLELTDGVFGLNFLFLGGQPPPSPGHLVCGEDPVGSLAALGCVTYETCN